MPRLAGTYCFEPGFSFILRCLSNCTKNTFKDLKSTGREHSEKCKNTYRILLWTWMQPGGFHANGAFFLRFYSFCFKHLGWSTWLSGVSHLIHINTVVMEDLPLHGIDVVQPVKFFFVIPLSLFHWLFHIDYSIESFSLTFNDLKSTGREHS